MRPNILIGIVLVVIGAFLFYRGGSFTTQKKVLEVGDVKVTAPDEHSVPNWIAPVAVIAGFGLIIFGGMQKRT